MQRWPRYAEEPRPNSCGNHQTRICRRPRRGSTVEGRIEEHRTPRRPHGVRRASRGQSLVEEEHGARHDPKRVYRRAPPIARRPRAANPKFASGEKSAIEKSRHSRRRVRSWRCRQRELPGNATGRRRGKARPRPLAPSREKARDVVGSATFIRRPVHPQTRMTSGSSRVAVGRARSGGRPSRLEYDFAVSGSSDRRQRRGGTLRADRFVARRV